MKETSTPDNRPQRPPETEKATSAKPRVQEGEPVEMAVTIMKPLEQVYSYWRDFSHLPDFMEHLEQVEIKSETSSRWTWQTIGNTQFKWDVQITEDVPNERISWTTQSDAAIQHSGTVEFRRSRAGQATEVLVHLRYTEPGGRLTKMLTKLVGEEPTQTWRQDLRRLRWILEAGEIPTIEGQPKGSGKKVH